MRLLKLCLLYSVLSLSLSSFATDQNTSETKLCRNVIEVGAAFLHSQDSQFHTSKFVELEALTQEISNSALPAVKIKAWLEKLDLLAQRPGFADLARRLAHKQFLIKGFSEGYIKKMIKDEVERGIDVDGYSAQEIKDRAESVRNIDKQIIEQWIQYFFIEDVKKYPMWLKHWVFSKLGKMGRFDVERSVFTKKSNLSVSTLPELNQEALEFTLNSVLKVANGETITHVLDQKFTQLLNNEQLNFSKLYAYAIGHLKHDKQVLLQNTTGQWVRYTTRSDRDKLVQNLQGWNTNWCSVGLKTADYQLCHGDLFIYFTEGTDGLKRVPRIAIRTERSSIEEVVGIAIDQRVDHVMAQTSIIDDKLKEFGEAGALYKKKVSDMKRLTYIVKKTQNQETLSTDDLLFLYEINAPIISFARVDYFEEPRDVRINEILRSRNTKEDLAKLFGLSTSHIILGVEGVRTNAIETVFYTTHNYMDLELSREKFIEMKQREEALLKLGASDDLVYQGNLVITDHMARALNYKLPKVIVGDLIFEARLTIADFQMPELVTGMIDLRAVSYVNQDQLSNTTYNSVQLPFGL